MLARHERGQREEAERKAAEVERQATERVQATERAAADRVKEAERIAAEVLRENDKLRELAKSLLGERTQLREALKELGREKDEVQLRADDYKARLSDIPMPEVMERMGYGNERVGDANVYRDAQGQVVLRVEQQKLLDQRNELICRNSIDLVVHMRRNNEGVQPFTHTQALEYLRQEFGDKRAAGAAVAHREQSAYGLFERLHEREHSIVQERGRDPWRGPRGQAEDHDRGGRSGRDDGPSRGGGGGFER